MSIIISNISYSYNNRSVLENAHIEIPTNNIYALVGRSGIGKTTLLNIIAGLYRDHNGEINISKRRYSYGCIKGIVFQDDCLLYWLNVFENLVFPRKHNRNIDHNLADSLLKISGLQDRKDSMPKELSTGMKKRLEFIRALYADEDYILADEPFGTVDAVNRRKLWRLWNELRNTQPRTGILCTHDPEEAIRLCDAIVPLQPTEPTKPGKIIEIPKGIKALAINDYNEELITLQKLVIDSI